MFTGFPSTQTPAVQWWDFSKTGVGTKQISLANDCAPIQYFATGGGTTTIQITLPSNAAQGKTITFRNDKYATSRQLIQINDPINGYPISKLGQGGSITCCYIFENSLTGTTSSNWAVINGPGGFNPSNYGALSFADLSNASAAYSSVFGGTNNNSSGAYSIILGGNGNNSIGNNSSVVGGTNNNSSGAYSIILGGNANNSIGNNCAVVGGSSNNAGDNSGVLAGIANNASQQYSAILGGSNNFTSGIVSAIMGGAYGTTRSISGNITSSASNSPISSVSGINQLAMLVLARQTTDATATVLCSDSNSAGTTNQIILPNNSAYYFRGECVAGVTGAGDAKGWYIEGVIKRGAGVGTTVLVGTPTVTSLYADTGAATWSLAVSADTTNGGLKVTATGAAATTIRWVAQIRTTEMTY